MRILKANNTVQLYAKNLYYNRMHIVDICAEECHIHRKNSTESKQQ